MYSCNKKTYSDNKWHTFNKITIKFSKNTYNKATMHVTRSNKIKDKNWNRQDGNKHQTQAIHNLLLAKYIQKYINTI